MGQAGHSALAASGMRGGRGRGREGSPHARPRRRAGGGGSWDIAVLCCFVLLLPYAAGAAAQYGGMHGAVLHGGDGGAGAGAVRHHVAAPDGYSPLRWHDVEAAGMTRYGDAGEEWDWLAAGIGGGAAWAAAAAHGWTGSAERPAAAPAPAPPPPAALGGILPLAHAQAQGSGQILEAVRVGSFGYSGGEFGRFDGPFGITSDPNGRIIVADTGNHRIVVMDRDGVHIRTIGGEGEGAGQFTYPYDVATDGSGRIIVSDRGNNRIQVFDIDYAFALEFGRAPNGTSQIGGVIGGVAADADGSIAVADQSSGAVHVFGPDGARSGTITGFSNQIDVAFDPDGNIVVFDSRSGRITFHEKDGRPAGRPSIAAAHSLSWPTVDVDPYGRIIVGGFPGNLAIYDPDGSLIASPLNPFGRIAWPQIAADPSGRVLAADWRNNLVYVLGASLVERYQIGGGDGDERLEGGLYGVAVDLSGNVVVPSAEPGGGGGTVYRLAPESGFDPVGATLVHENLASPRGAAVGPGGEIIVADAGRPGDPGAPGDHGPGVVIFGVEGDARKVTTYGGRSFEDPAGVAAYADAGGSGRIAVADNVGSPGGGRAGRIVILNMSGGFVDSFGGRILSSAAGVAVDGRSGDIVVADPANGTIKVFSQGGALLRTLDPDGSRMPAPTGVAVDRYGRIAVSGAGEAKTLALIDPVSGSAHGRIEFVDGGGGGGGREEGTGLAGVAIAHGGDIMVVDRSDSVVIVAAASLRKTAELASAGGDDGSFRSPADVAVDPADGRIIVADTGNHRVQVFDSSTRHRLTFGSEGSGMLHMRSPMGVAAGPGGTIVVADTGNDRVAVYDRLGGHAVAVEGAAGAPDPAALDSPGSVSVDPADGRIIVADTGNDRVVVLNADRTHNATLLEAGGVRLSGPPAWPPAPTAASA